MSSPAELMVAIALPGLPPEMIGKVAAFAETLLSDGYDVGYNAAKLNRVQSIERGAQSMFECIQQGLSSGELTAENILEAHIHVDVTETDTSLDLEIAVCQSVRDGVPQGLMDELRKLAQDHGIDFGSIILDKDGEPTLSEIEAAANNAPDDREIDDGGTAWENEHSRNLH